MVICSLSVLRTEVRLQVIAVRRLFSELVKQPEQGASLNAAFRIAISNAIFIYLLCVMGIGHRAKTDTAFMVAMPWA